MLERSVGGHRAGVGTASEEKVIGYWYGRLFRLSSGSSMDNGSDEFSSGQGFGSCVEKTRLREATWLQVLGATSTSF